MINDLRLYGVQSFELDYIWPHVEGYITEALAYADNKFTLDDILKFLKSRDMQLWIICKDATAQGVVVTQIICYPQEKRLCLVLVAGVDFDKWQHFWYPIRDWAKRNGCNACEMYGRPGWEKKLKSIGFEKIHTVLKTSL